MLGCRCVGRGQKNVRVDEQHPRSDTFGELLRREISAFLVDIERFGSPRRADPDERQPMLRALYGKAGGELRDELVESDTATRRFCFEAGLRFGGKFERHVHRVDCRGWR